MGKILAVAPAAIPISIDPNEKPYIAGILNDIDKAKRAQELQQEPLLEQN